jgi:UvrB/uvrC motif
MRRDIDDALANWPYEPEPGEMVAREIRARDGRSVIQVRVELGLHQMEVDGRPDGVRPHGLTTYLDYLRHRAAGRGQTPGGKSPPWTMSERQCIEADREFVQFHHRRAAWLALERYDRALSDADHTLALMDFVCRHAGSKDYVASHERLRGLVLFQRTRAAAALALKRDKPDEAIDIVRDGVMLLDAARVKIEDADEEDESPNAALVEQLRYLESEIRKNYEVPATLGEQLDEAISCEDYERAALIRDQIQSRKKR